MVILAELTNYLNSLFDLTIRDYCPNGLQVEGKQHVKKIATAVSASLKTVQRAAEEGVDALIVHHGLFWNGDSPVITGAKREKIKCLIEGGISLFAYHLPLDAHPEVGNNWRAAKEMGWNDLESFGPYNGVEIGVKGTFPAISAGEFAKQLEKYYGHSAVEALGGKERVSSAGLISGGAWKSFGDAKLENLDCFVTGSFDEPVWHQAFEEKVNFFALGHTATERVGPKALQKALEAAFSLPVEFIDLENPF